MSKSNRADRRYEDEWYERETKKPNKTQRRQDKRSARELPCEKEDLKSFNHLGEF